MREVFVDVAYTPNRDSWQIVLEASDGGELTAQDIIDSLANFLLEEGELDPFPSHGPRDFDA